MRNNQPSDFQYPGFLPFLKLVVLFVFRVITSWVFILGIVVGMSITIPVFTSAVQQWVDNGGLSEFCSQDQK